MHWVTLTWLLFSNLLFWNNYSFTRSFENITEVTGTQNPPGVTSYLILVQGKSLDGTLYSVCAYFCLDLSRVWIIAATTKPETQNYSIAVKTSLLLHSCHHTHLPVSHHPQSLTITHLFFFNLYGITQHVPFWPNFFIHHSVLEISDSYKICIFKSLILVFYWVAFHGMNGSHCF